MSEPTNTGRAGGPAGPIERIEAALARVGAEHQPPVGWEAKVLAATAPPEPRRSWWWLALPGMLAAAVAIFLLLPGEPSALKLAIAIDEGPTVLRANRSDPQLGDVVRATATGGGTERAVWVYRDENKLVIACPGPTNCRQSDDALTAVIDLTAVGTYQIVVLSSNKPLPKPTGHFDEDAAAAAQANVTQSRHDLTVR